MGIIWYQVSCFGATFRITVLNYQPKRPASWNSSRHDLKLDVLCNLRVGSPRPCLSRKTHWIDCAYDCFCCLITSQLCIYPLVMTHIAIEYGHLQCVFQSKMVMFHSYASFPEGIHWQDVYEYSLILNTHDEKGDIWDRVFCPSGDSLEDPTTLQQGPPMRLVAMSGRRLARTHAHAPM